MNLQQLIQQYLAYRKSLGECPRPDGGHLGAFGRFIGADANIADVRAKQVNAFLAGAGPITATWHIKLSVLRPFYRYAISRGYLAAAPLPTVVPKRPPAFVPYIFSHEDLRHLLATIDTDNRYRACLKPATMRTMLLLLYGTGLRISEAVNLNCADVDLKAFLLTVRHTKFFKTRLVPFGTQLGSALAPYAQIRVSEREAPFFTTRNGTRVKPDTFHHNFRILCKHAGIQRADDARYQPRVHDLRHTFAVHRLTSWYRQGADVQKLLPQLSTYLGHAHLRGTQVYLSMTPELLQEANRRFEHYARNEGCHD
jgi:integrase/recombinase XerD